MERINPTIAGVVLAAGASRRMGKPKLVLPWGASTVIGHVVDVLHQAGIAPILVVTGAHRRQVEAALRDSPAGTVYNPRHAQEEMVYSLQVGLSAMPQYVDALLIALGDQPQIHVNLVTSLVKAFCQSRKAILVPSYHMRRGHPWLVHRSLWPALLTLNPPQTLRSFLRQHEEHIFYLPVDDEAILSDLDTPEDYARQCPR